MRAKLQLARRLGAAGGLVVPLELGAAVLGLVVGLLAHALGATMVARAGWALATLVVLVPALASGAVSLARRRVTVDVVAVLAMAGALALGELLAGAVIAAMLSGGAALEAYASARARRELNALLSRAPRRAHRRDGEALSDCDVDAVEVGDVLVVKPGEVVPADGVVLSAGATLDESALTGESRPVQRERGERVRSGVTNAGAALELRVGERPSESTYAGIVRLVEEAERKKAPFVRLADRYAVWFVWLTLATALLAALLSGDPLRALAVLVVATPCPLIIAAPVALVGGVSRAARGGVLIKGGGPLEALAGVSVVLLDKTGTVTTSRPELASVESFGELASDEVLALAASLEQLSLHPFAPAIVAEARDRELSLSVPSEAREQAGLGIVGLVGQRRVALGQLSYVAPAETASVAARSVALRTSVEGASAVYVAIDAKLVGALLLHNPIRAEAPRVIEGLRREGVRAVHIVTGDHPDVAELVGDALGADRVYAERAPDEKVEVLRAVAAEGSTLMVGDGVNDAPALALADVGVAMGASGASAASEAADVVLVSDRLDGLLLARRIARRARRIAHQSALGGMGLSLAAMVLAALGALSPVEGALIQEAIDVAVILNALRVLRGGPSLRGARTDALARELKDAHRKLRPQIAELAALAARLDALPPAEAKQALSDARVRLEHDLLPHELREQETAYPRLRELMAPDDPTGPLIRTHHEIRRLVRLFGRLLEQLPEQGPGPSDLRDLRRSLYGLHAVLSLHIGQEDELYSILDG